MVPRSILKPQHDFLWYNRYSTKFTYSLKGVLLQLYYYCNFTNEQGNIWNMNLD